MNDLRKRAEELLRDKSPAEMARMPFEDMQGLVHELRVHQVELEMQNEELRRAQVELADSRDRYLDLYEMAPVGYVTLDEHRIVREANLTFCQLLGAEREQLIGRRIDEFAAGEQRDACFREFRNVLKFRTEHAFALQFQRRDGSFFWAGIKGVPNAPETAWPRGCRGIISDITARKEAEEAIQHHARELEAFNQRMVGRELRMVELKKEVNALCEQLGRPAAYPAEFLREDGVANDARAVNPSNDHPGEEQA